MIKWTNVSNKGFFQPRNDIMVLKMTHTKDDQDVKILLPSGELDILCGVTMCSRLYVSLQEIKYNQTNTISELRKLIVVE